MDVRVRLGPILRAARTIAVVGMSPDPLRPSHVVAAYLQNAGYRIVPVRPGVDFLRGERAFPSLTAARETVGPLDIVNVFRRSATIPAIADELLAIRPALVWMQVGVRDEATATRLEAAGIPVVMNRCLMVDHPWLTSE
jgi:predicted CoA-binding protein